MLYYCLKKYDQHKNIRNPGSDSQKIYLVY